MKRKVLIIDDNADFREFFRESLTKLGLETVTAITGRIAIARAKEHEPDLVLCDMMLPDMDGFEVCRELRELETFSNTPIIFVSAFSSEKHIERAIAVGANDYLIKPLSVADLKALVTRYLGE